MFYKQFAMIIRLLLFQLFFVVLSNLIVAQNQPKKEYFTQECSKNEISIDGKFDEPAWMKASWQGDFIQYDPSEGKKPWQKTDFAILYDENYVYIGFKAWDTHPDSIVQRLTNRDDVDGDIVFVEFDSYFDKRTSFSFMVSVAGTKYDYILSDDGQKLDNTWDPIWLVKTSRDQLGWYAEIRIPLTQLRYEGNNEQTWGLQVGRNLFRKSEVSTWQPISKKMPGWASKYGELKGLKNLKSKKVADMFPYALARTDRFEKENGDPFRESGRKNHVNVGLDGKIGLTNNMTLDFTINPDFGQVDADPSQVNLTSFETFFQEKRPFFVEGKNILSLPLEFSGGDLSSENLFYSRRIGRQPQYNPALKDGEYKDAPEFTSILGAAKITGKTKNGLSLGILESLTSEEFAKIGNGQHQHNEAIEPFTNYTVGRVQKDFNGGNTLLGGMVTSVNRNQDVEQLKYLHKSSYTGGMDFVHKWHNKDWEFDLSTYFSRVQGCTEAICNTQKSSVHLFQRPDATNVKFDSTRTSLSGQGGKIQVGKMGGKLQFGASTAWKSPGLELNDIGYMRQADDILGILWAGYRFFEPFSIFRNLNFGIHQYKEWNFAGESTGSREYITVDGQLKNYWYFNFGTNGNGEKLSTTELRGGPAIKLPGTKDISVSIGSNILKKLTANMNFVSLKGDIENSKRMTNFGIDLGYRPSNNLKINISPNFTSSDEGLQYVTQQVYANKRDYIFARINQKTVSASLRVNFLISPDLSIQYWGQPFLSCGKYSEFKRITDSRADYYADRFSLLTNNELTYLTSEEKYQVSDPGGSLLYKFDQPDFNVKQFLSNMVVRWEYLPGSTMYLVWSQTRNQSISNGNFDFQKDMTKLFDYKPYNVFQLKMSFRLGCC